MNTLPSLAADASKQLVTFHRSSTPGTTTYLDPSDPGHHSIITTMLAAAGHTQELYPHLYEALNKGAAFTGAPSLDRTDLVDAGKTASGKATATVVSASSGDTMIKGGSLMIFDSDSGELLAHGHNTDVRNGFLQCAANSDQAKPAGKGLSILYLGHATDADGTTRFYSTTHATDVPEQGITVNVVNPVIQISGNTQIHIAVGRVSTIPPPANTDYRYIEPSNETSDPYLIVPFQGTVGLSGTINFSALTTNNLIAAVYVNNGNGNAVAVGRAGQYTTDSYFLSTFQQGAAPNILSWAFPYDQKGYASTKSIVYNPASMANEVDSFFYFAFINIPLAGGGIAPPFYVCSINTPEEPSLNCTKIPNLYFWWHCLAKGTLVTLEDGTQKPIEELNETFRVKTPQGSLAVTATVQGRHSSDPSSPGRKEVYRLTTTNGHTITATAIHTLFMEPGKCRAIAHMAAGDPILTEEGPSTVASNEAIEYEGMFYGLLLGNPEEQKNKDFPTNLAGYFGGGVLHGDQQAMRHHVRAAYRDLDYMLPRILPALHQDYTSALKQNRY